METSKGSENKRKYSCVMWCYFTGCTSSENMFNLPITKVLFGAYLYMKLMNAVWVCKTQRGLMEKEISWLQEQISFWVFISSFYY